MIVLAALVACDSPADDADVEYDPCNFHYWGDPPVCERLPPAAAAGP